MLRTLSMTLAVATLGLTAFAPAPAQDADGTTDEGVHRSALHDFRVVTVVEGLEMPWSIAFLPDGDMLVTEKPGRLRIVRDGRLLPDPVAGVPEVLFVGQGGLLEVSPHPGFADNRLLYLTYSKAVPEDEEQGTTAVTRGRLVNDALVDVEEIFVAESRGRSHYGSRLAFDADGYLYITVGDRQAPPRGELEAHPAQDLSNHNGVTLRLFDDGTVPEDNPFVGVEGTLPEIFSYGHRNAQGMAIHPDTGDIWQTEHGPQGGDELNVVEAGANYGWPVIGYGVNYGNGTAIHGGTLHPDMEQPRHVWVPSIATSGLMIYTGEAFPEWKGDLFAGGLAGRQLARLDLLDAASRTIGVEETLLYGLGRVRDVRQGPDDLVYVAIDSGRDPDRDTAPILRLEPVDDCPC